ncbi:protein fantom [Plakobranchus ocellatus]|uniref:Protein fantom n=1 Tax=Plakobranchus ocellatus TaxID=259542 RepID=A0AAV3Z5E3_9GAST|nr:protein fantom [Plakobranchus ocellatus]
MSCILLFSSTDHRKALVELQAEYAETVHELEKTRNMLVVQHKINKDYQTEVNLATGKLDDVKKEYEMKLDEYARLLDIRAARIKKLEAQLRDVAYGTRQYRLPQPDDDAESTMDFDETISLERGQNLFEIHIEKINLSKDAMEIIGDEDPLLFCTWEFFEFEIISTPVVRGARPLFDFTSQYIVKVDDFFLHYLQKETCTVELHQSLGQDYSTIAACQMVFRDIFDKPHGRIHGTATLTGVSDGETGVGYGTIDYWIRLRVPMDQALRLFKERTKALGYIMTNERMASQALEALDETAAQRPPDNVNQLHVKVIRCHKLVCRRQNVQPSPYCAYKVLDFPDHATIILRSTNDPEFNDHKIYSVPVTFQLDQYIRTAKLQMFVFDDTDPELEAYLGVAEIPLLPLAHNSPVTGQFQLTRGQGKVAAGVIEVELKWQYPYLPPKVAKHSLQELEMAPDEPPTRLRPDRPTREELVSPVQPVKRRAEGTKPQPSATSTPLDADKLRAAEAQVVQGQPKPVSRRKVHMADEAPSYSEEVKADSKSADQVDDTVSQVVSGFMPNMSESISSSTVQDVSTPQLLETPHSVAGESALPAPTQEEESEEGEELSARPTPPRSSLQIESGSEESADAARISKDSQGPSAGEEEEEEVEEEIEEEVAEEVIEEEEIMREEAHKDEEEEFEGSVRESQESTETEPVAMESDSEGVMVEQSSTLKKKSKRSKASDNITIVISELTLEEDSPPMLDENVRHLFVEYHLNGVDPMETETPFSLPKPKPYQSIAYNFSKTIAVDLKHHHNRRAYLASMLLPGHPDKGRLKFTVVSEPPQPTGPAESTEMECEDVGVAFVDMKRILLEEKDLKDEQIEIKDVETESTVIGNMVVTVECAEVLKAVASEMEVEGTF